MRGRAARTIRADHVDSWFPGGAPVFGWVAEHPELIVPALLVVGLAFYGIVLGVPPVRRRVLRRLPCLATHTVRVTLDASDPAVTASALARLHVLTSRSRWSPAPPSYHVRTTVAVDHDGAARVREVLLTSTSYHLRRNRAAAEAALEAYLATVASIERAD